MACIEGTANTVKELFQEIVTFLIDPTNFEAGNQWTLLSPGALDANTTEVILRGVGDGEDEIYVGMKIKANGNNQEDICLNGFAGFDPYLEWYEQPGAIPETYKLPCVPLAKDVFMTYWLAANSSRFTFVVELSNQYEGAYAGLFQPIAIERQYPYPLAIGGSFIEGQPWTSRVDAHSLFTTPALFGAHSSLCIRRPDGLWRYAGAKSAALTVWPTNRGPVDTFTLYRADGKEDPLKDHMLFPILLYENDPVGVLGQLDELYFVGNRADLAAKDNILYKDKIYKVFSNVHRREDDAYFAMGWF